MKTLKHQQATRRLIKATACFQRKTVQVVRLLLTAIDLVAHLAGLGAERNPIGARVGDKGNGTAVYTIAHTELFTYGKTGIP